MGVNLVGGLQGLTPQEFQAVKFTAIVLLCAPNDKSQIASD